jgi:hypothetical protein
MNVFAPGQPLKPAKNVRKVIPRVCATCAYGTIEDGGFFCWRQDGYSCDAGDMFHWFRVCDRYKASEEQTA